MLGHVAGRRLRSPGLMVILRGTNLLDADIRQHTSMLKNLVPLPGLSLHFGLRYEF